MTGFIYFVQDIATPSSSKVMNPRFNKDKSNKKSKPRPRVEIEYEMENQPQERLRA